MGNGPKDNLAEYRRHLQSAEQKSQEDFDKTVLSLSGGALGISFVFLKDVIGPNPIVAPSFLIGAWVSWGVSTSCVLASYYLSHLALRKAIRQIDENKIHAEPVGGWFTRATAILNASGAALFFVGVIAITLFAHGNLKTKELKNDRSKEAVIAPASTPVAPASTPVAPASDVSVTKGGANN